MNFLLSRGLFGGARQHQKVDGRIIASINKNLLTLVKKSELWELDEIDSKLKKIIVSTYERVHYEALKHKMDWLYGCSDRSLVPAGNGLQRKRNFPVIIVQ